jgi:low temperature requirement protein LtrA
MPEREQRVTPLELFFDLVFVYAITQVTTLMSEDLTWRGVGHGLVVFAALWWAWTGYAWLTNTIEPEEGLVRAGIFGGMVGMLVAALAVPRAFGGGAAPFGVAFALVRLINLALYGIAGKRDADFRRTIARFAPTATIGPVLILAGVFVEGGARTVLWVVAVVALYAGPLIDRGRGWRISPDHFAERYGLIVIIALGESIFAIGVAEPASRRPRSSSHRRSWAWRSSPRSGGPTSTSWRSLPSVSSRRRPARGGPGWRATATATCTCRWSLGSSRSPPD